MIFVMMKLAPTHRLIDPQKSPQSENASHRSQPKRYMAVPQYNTAAQRTVRILSPFRQFKFNNIIAMLTLPCMLMISIKGRFLVAQDGRHRQGFFWREHSQSKLRHPLTQGYHSLIRRGGHKVPQRFVTRSIPLSQLIASPLLFV